MVERDRIVTGAAIQPGDAVVGLPSSGLHTNGYSLARRIFAEDDLDTYVPELGRTLGDELLQPHRSYFEAIWPLLEAGLVSGMAHITGGGLTDNLPRVVPPQLAVTLDAARWDVLPIFRLMQWRGNLSWEEMRRVFNLGLGYLVFCHPSDLPAVLEATSTWGGRQVGSVRERRGDEPRVHVEGLA